jgi:hypothetical protein
MTIKKQIAAIQKESLQPASEVNNMSLAGKIMTLAADLQKDETTVTLEDFESFDNEILKSLLSIWAAAVGQQLYTT